MYLYFSFSPFHLSVMNHSSNNVHKRLQVLCFIVCLTFLLRSVDPFGFRAWIHPAPYTVNFSICAAAIYCSVLVIIRVWTVALYSGYPPLKVELAFIIAHITVWTFMLSIALLETVLGPLWFWNSVRNLLIIVTLSILVITTVVAGRKIHDTVEIDEESNFSDSNGSATRTSTRLKRRALLDKISWLVLIMICSSVMIVLLCVRTVVRNFSDKYDYETNPPPLPTFREMILWYAVPDIVQYLVLWVIIVAFRFKPKEAEARLLTDSHFVGAGNVTPFLGRGSRSASQAGYFEYGSDLDYDDYDASSVSSYVDDDGVLPYHHHRWAVQSIPNMESTEHGSISIHNASSFSDTSFRSPRA